MQIEVIDALPLPPVEDGMVLIDCPVCSTVVRAVAAEFQAGNRDWRTRQGDEVAAAVAGLPELAGHLGPGRAVGFLRCPGCGALFVLVTAESDGAVTPERVLHVRISN